MSSRVCFEPELALLPDAGALVDVPAAAGGGPVLAAVAAGEGVAAVDVELAVLGQAPAAQPAPQPLVAVAAIQFLKYFTRAVWKTIV